MDSVKSNDQRFKYKRFTLSCCKDLVMREFEFVAKTQFLSFSDFFKIEITNNI